MVQKWEKQSFSHNFSKKDLVKKEGDGKCLYDGVMYQFMIFVTNGFMKEA